MSRQPTIIQGPFPGQAVEAHFRRYGRLPNEYAEGCPFSNKPDISCTSPECGCLDEDDDATIERTCIGAMAALLGIIIFSLVIGVYYGWQQ